MESYNKKYYEENRERLIEKAKENKDKPIVIYTDGSCLGNPGPGGWAFIVIQKQIKSFQGNDKETTNNKMELTAVKEALIYVKSKKKKNCVIYSDSKYLIDGITKWMEGWKKRNWYNVKNPELWKEIDLLNSKLNVSYEWVKAHNGDKYNEMVDQLARSQAELIKSQ